MSLRADHPRVRIPHRPSGPGSSIQGAELHYFFLRGLGEVPRLLLELTETPYDSVMYFSRDVKEYKAYAPFGQMPLYTDKDLGTFIAQQGAIVRHIARSAGLAGKTPADEAHIDMLFEGAKDIWGKKDLIHEGPDSESPDAKKLKMFLGAAAKLLGDKSYFVYDSPTYADVAMFHVLHSLEEICSLTQTASYVKAVGHTNLVAFVERFRALPPIAAYLRYAQRPQLTASQLTTQAHLNSIKLAATCGNACGSRLHYCAKTHCRVWPAARNGGFPSLRRSSARAPLNMLSAIRSRPRPWTLWTRPSCEWQRAQPRGGRRTKMGHRMSEWCQSSCGQQVEW